MLKFKTIGVDSELTQVTLDIPEESLQQKNLIPKTKFLEPIAENSLRDQILKGREDISLGLVITMGIKLVKDMIQNFGSIQKEIISNLSIISMPAKKTALAALTPFSGAAASCVAAVFTAWQIKSATNTVIKLFETPSFQAIIYTTVFCIIRYAGILDFVLGIPGDLLNGLIFVGRYKEKQTRKAFILLCNSDAASYTTLLSLLHLANLIVVSIFMIPVLQNKKVSVEMDLWGAPTFIYERENYKAVYRMPLYVRYFLTGLLFLLLSYSLYGPIHQKFTIFIAKNFGVRCLIVYNCLSGFLILSNYWLFGILYAILSETTSFSIFQQVRPTTKMVDTIRTVKNYLDKEKQ